MEKITQIILTADEGMYLTNGDVYVKEIRLPETADENLWHEITEEEYSAILETETELAESEAKANG